MNMNTNQFKKVEASKDPHALIDITCPKCQHTFDATAIIRKEVKIALTPSLLNERKRVLQELKSEVPQQDDLKAHTELHKTFQEGANWALLHTHAAIDRKIASITKQLEK